MPRPRLAMLTVVLIAAAWLVPSQWLYWLGLRELFRLGELIGITSTPPGAGARLAGQILGFNYAQPPLWYELLTRATAAATAFGPAIVISLWLHRRLGLGRPSVAPRAPFAPIVRAATSLAAAGAAFSILEHLSGGTLWRIFLGIGEAIGGQVVRLGGFEITTGGGPFIGGTTADMIGNLLVRQGPYATLLATAFAAAHAVDWALWRSDVRRVRGQHLCPHCGYDLRGLTTATTCPECGKVLPSAQNH